MTQKTFFGACVTVVNMVVGSGVLAIPHAFLSAGVVLAPLVLSLFAVTAFCSIVWLFECQLRAWALNEAYVQGKLSLKPAGRESEFDDVLSDDEAVRVQHSVLSAANNVDEVLLNSFPKGQEEAVTFGDDLETKGALDNQATGHLSTPFITRVKALCSQGKFFRYTLEPRCEGDAAAVSADVSSAVNFDAFTTDDVIEMDDVVTAFGGRIVAAVWNVSQILEISAVIWLYFVVLCETALQGIGLGSYAPRNHCNRSDKIVMATDECQSGVRVYCAIFWVVLGALTVRDWKIMPYIHRGMSFLVYAGLSTLTITAFIGLFTKEYVAPTLTSSSANHMSFSVQKSAPYSQHVSNFDFSKFSDLFGVSVFCLLCHPGSAIIIRTMPTKESGVKVYAASFGSVVGMYILMAIVVVFYMGGDTSSIVTLNWSNYSQWGIPGWGGEVLGGFVMLFPVASISASLTLCARCLAESAEAIIPASALAAACRAVGVTYYAKCWQVQVVLRLFFISVPAGLCMISSNFETALSCAGTLGFFLLYFVPCAVQWESKRLMKKVGLVSPCDSWIGHPAVIVAIFVIALAACGYYVKASLIGAF